MREEQDTGSQVLVVVAIVAVLVLVIIVVGYAWYQRSGPVVIRERVEPPIVIQPPVDLPEPPPVTVEPPPIVITPPAPPAEQPEVPPAEQPAPMTEPTP